MNLKHGHYYIDPDHSTTELNTIWRYDKAGNQIRLIDNQHCGAYDCWTATVYMQYATKNFKEVEPFKKDTYARVLKPFRNFEKGDICKIKTCGDTLLALILKDGTSRQIPKSYVDWVPYARRIKSKYEFKRDYGEKWVNVSNTQWAACWADGMDRMHGQPLTDEQSIESLERSVSINRYSYTKEMITKPNLIDIDKVIDIWGDSVDTSECEPGLHVGNLKDFSDAMSEVLEKELYRYPIPTPRKKTGYKPSKDNSINTPLFKPKTSKKSINFKF